MRVDSSHAARQPMHLVMLHGRGFNNIRSFHATGGGFFGSVGHFFKHAAKKVADVGKDVGSAVKDIGKNAAKAGLDAGLKALPAAIASGNPEIALAAAGAAATDSAKQGAMQKLQGGGLRNRKRRRPRVM